MAEMLPRRGRRQCAGNHCATVWGWSVDAIVVGGGAMGTAAARELAERGRETLLLERFTPGHANGSSGGPTRIFRYAYHRDDYVRLVGLARAAWHELEVAAGEQLLQVTGGIDVGAEALHRADLLEAAGIPVERLRGADVRERWPALRLPANADVMFQPQGGVITRPLRCSPKHASRPKRERAYEQM